MKKKEYKAIYMSDNIELPLHFKAFSLKNAIQKAKGRESEYVKLKAIYVLNKIYEEE